MLVFRELEVMSDRSQAVCDSPGLQRRHKLEKSSTGLGLSSACEPGLGGA